jgi:hypothetical protein
MCKSSLPTLHLQLLFINLSPPGSQYLQKNVYVSGVDPIKSTVSSVLYCGVICSSPRVTWIQPFVCYNRYEQLSQSPDNNNDDIILTDRIIIPK